VDGKAAIRRAIAKEPTPRGRGHLMRRGGNVVNKLERGCATSKSSELSSAPRSRRRRPLRLRRRGARASSRSSRRGVSRRDRAQ
jgi:hypothetical protein